MIFNIKFALNLTGQSSNRDKEEIYLTGWHTKTALNVHSYITNGHCSAISRDKLIIFGTYIRIKIKNNANT